MLPTTYNYVITPSVILADTKVQMTVCAAEPAYMMPDGNEYFLNIISVNTDENYYNPENHKKLSALAKGGVLTFDFTFEGEGEHVIQLISDEKVLQTLKVFSLYPDLYALTSLRGDFHSHSCRSDGTRDPASQIGHYREQGYDFAALTDHNRFFTGEEIDKLYSGVNTGFTRVSGEEVHCPGSVVHIVHVGGKKSVAAEYVHNRERYEKDLEGYMSKVPDCIPEKYKSRYAKAMWATEKIHEAGGIAIFPHPFWRPAKAQSFNVCDEFAGPLLKSGMFDAYELLGAMQQPENNRSVAFWCDLRSEGYKINVVGSSDTHALEKTQTFPNNFTIVFAEENTGDSIIEAVKGGMSVAVEAVGYEYDRQYRSYGSMRLVTYANFLLANYFPKLQRISSGTGIAMRSYVMGDADADVINKQTEMVERFKARFFGRIAPLLPTEKLLAFEEEAREKQLTLGPRTRGSSVDATPAKNLI